MDTNSSVLIWCVHLCVTLHCGGNTVHQLIDDVNHPVRRHQVRLHDHTFLPAAVDTDLSLTVLEEQTDGVSHQVNHTGSITPE